MDVIDGVVKFVRSRAVFPMSMSIYGSEVQECELGTDSVGCR